MTRPFVYGIPSGRVLGVKLKLKGHGHTVDKVSFNPVREFELASCSADGTIRFWDTRTKNAVAKLDVGGDRDPFTLAWSTDGSTLVAGTKVIDRIPHATMQRPSH